MSKGEEGKRLPTIKGMVPSLSSLPGGCKFNPRCPDVMPECGASVPALRPLAAADRAVACFKHHDAEGRPR